MHLILPKTRPDVKDIRAPLFFLAGPIQGGGDWHVRMTELLEKKFEDCIIVNPSRYDETHPLYRYRLDGQEDYFPHQTAWERYYMRQAASQSHGHGSGCLIFWLPVESDENPRADGKPYAMDTRGEIGEWRGHMAYRAPNGLRPRVVMGGESDFPSMRTIKRNNEDAIGAELPMHETMEEVVLAAVDRTYSRP